MARTGDQFKALDAKGIASTITLGEQITSSGEGEIWHTSVAGQIGKIYLSQQAQAQRAEKLQVMLTNPPKDPAGQNHISIAWPTATLRDGRGTVVGFTMPEVVAAKRPPVLYNQKLRKVAASGIDWFYVHTAAHNVAKVCHAVHERGYLIGDLKAENWLVDRSMMTVVIDTDSFQVRDPQTGRLYRCPVGTPEYTAPEIMNRNFSTFDRVAEHDHFAMAVLIYQFLLGQHPFTGGEYRGRGAAPTETTERISKGLWLYAKGGQYRPVQTDVPFDVLHPELQALFTRCFDDGHGRPAARPSAKEWEIALETAISALAWCSVGEMHVYSGHQKRCSWCALQKATGFDRWPNYGKSASQSFGVAKRRLREAFRDGNFLQVLYALDSNPRLAKEKDLAPIVAEANKLRPLAKAFEELRAELAKPEPDAVAIADRLEREPRLAELAHRHPDMSARVAELLALEAAIKDLQRAIDSSPLRGNRYSIDGERSIASAFQRQEATLRSQTSLENRFGSRVKDARLRVGCFEKITKALADGDEMTVHRVVAEYAGPLATLLEYEPLAAEAELISRRVAVIRQFIEEAARPDADDDKLCRLWEGGPDLGRSKLARSPSDQLVQHAPLQRYERAKRRRDAAAALSALITSKEAQSRAEILEHHEREILAAYRDAEAKVGTLDLVSGGSLKQRAKAAGQRLSVFAEVGRLVALPEEHDCDIARYWHDVKEAHRYQLASAVRARLTEAEASCRLVEGMLAIASRAPTDEIAIVAYADGHPKLQGLRVASAVRVDGVPITERVRMARERVAALTAVRLAIAKADAASSKTEAGEQTVLEAWQQHASQLAHWPVARVKVEERVKLATERLSRTRQLETARARGDQAGLLEAWGSDGALDDYVPARDFRTAVDGARNVAMAFSGLRDRLARRDTDDAAILSVANSVGSLMASPYATSPLAELDGQSIHGLVEFSRRRAGFVDLMLAAKSDPSGRRLLGLARAWDGKYGTDHPRIKPNSMLVDRALRLAERLQALIRAANAGVGAEVVELWNDEYFSGLEEIEVVAQRIKHSLRNYVENAHPFRARQLGAVTQRPGNRALLSWDWVDERISHAYVMIGDKRPPHDHASALESLLVSRADLADREGLEVRFNGRHLVAKVQPVLLFDNERLEGSHGIVLREDSRRVLSYRVQGAMLGLGTRVLEIEMDRPVPLPELDLVASDGEKIGEWGEIPTDNDGKTSIELGGGLSFKRRSVMLRLKHARDSDWVEIRHPVEAQRKIAG